MGVEAVSTSTHRGYCTVDANRPGLNLDQDPGS